MLARAPVVEIGFPPKVERWRLGATDSTSSYGEAVAEALGQHDHVRLDVECVYAPEVGAGAPETRLDLVRNEEYAPLIQNPLDPLEVPGRRLDEAPNTLYGLGDERRDVPGGLLLDDRPHVVGAQEVASPFVPAQGAAQLIRVAGVGDVEGGAARRAPGALAGYAHRHEGAAVVGGAQGYYFAGVPITRREQERRLVRLRAAPHEKDLLLARDRGEFDQLLGELHLVLDQVQGRGVQDLVDLPLYRLGDLRYGVAANSRHNSSEVVQVLVPLRVPYPEPLAAHELHRLLVVKRRPGRQRGPVPLQ
jgi:hypothetical protein